jgi:hypothetical protein
VNSQKNRNFQSRFSRIHFWNELLARITFFWSFAVSFSFGTDWRCIFVSCGVNGLPSTIKNKKILRQ